MLRNQTLCYVAPYYYTIGYGYMDRKEENECEGNRLCEGHGKELGQDFDDDDDDNFCSFEYLFSYSVFK